MGKKTKVGKQRKDKYYHLAKETGYRSRAAFKLIQLNRKYEFLQKSRVCVDLCAAPGGWMQVARQNMPVSSIVIGVDLFPIPPIAGCISLVEDITTDKCKTAISRELKTWKADVVLNDGAPNVGKNWLHDAFAQTVLTLSALKLATQLLRPGGWFVTKVFRSKDYEALLWVLKQLFKKVHVTKPQASRSESAEIFVVCQYFIAPDKVDPKFFDPKHVFSDLDVEPSNKLNIARPRMGKAKAIGYPENDYTLYHKMSVADFIAHPTGIEALQTTSEIVFDDDKITSHPKTTKEIIECCKDIKVCGRKDLRSLLTWWKELHHEFHVKPEEEKAAQTEAELKSAAVAAEGDDEEDEEDAEEAAINKEIVELRAEAAKELKRKKKKIQKERLKLNERMNLKMIHKGDEGPRLEGDEMFTLKEIKSHEILQKVTDQSPDVVAESDLDSDDEAQLSKKLKYEKETGHLSSSGSHYKRDGDESLSENEEGEDSDSDKSGLGFSDSENEDDELIDTKKNKKIQRMKANDEDELENNPLITDLDSRDRKTKKVHRAELWFERDVFKNLVNEKDEDLELDKMVEVYKKRSQAANGSQDEVESKPNLGDSKKQNGIKKEDDESSDSDYDMDDFINSETKNIKKEKKIGGADGYEVVPKEKSTKPFGKRKLNDQDLALGSLLVQSKKSRRDLIDGAWNRYAFNDERLPDWFVQDEGKHMKKEAPVPKELVDEYKKRVEDLNVRPIKKVIEAKSRKAKRSMRKLEKAKKKVEALMEDVDVSSREKAKKIKEVYSKARREPKKEVTYIVAKKFNAGRKAARPAGVKGHYKMVDPRMKKELRAAKAKEKTKGRGKKSRAPKPQRFKPKSKPQKNRRKKK